MANYIPDLETIIVPETDEYELYGSLADIRTPINTIKGYADLLEMVFPVDASNSGQLASIGDISNQLWQLAGEAKPFQMLKDKQ